MSAADIRRNWNDQAERLFAAERSREAYKAARAIEWEIIEASRHDLPGRKLDTDTYIEHKIKLGNFDSKIAKLDCLINLRERIWHSMPVPKKRRPRRTVLVDGVRTKLEYAR